MKNIAVTELKQTLRLVWKNKLIWLACASVELFFFVIYGFATAPIYAKLVEYTNNIGIEAMGKFQTFESFSSIITHPEMVPYFVDVGLLLLLLAVTVFLLYVLLNGFLWNMAGSIAGKKIKYLDYLKKFVKVNLIWFVFFAVFYFASFGIKIRTVLLKVIANIEPSFVLGYFLIAYLVIISYFASISYVTLNLKKAFKLGIKLKQTIPPIVIIFLYFFILQLIIGQAQNLNHWFGFAVGVITLMPSFTIARVYVARVVKKL